MNQDLQNDIVIIFYR